MTYLALTEHKGTPVTESREVAKTVGKRHTELLRSIDNYITVLLNAKMRSVDFFIPATYLDESGKKNKMYLLTRKGCDMVANKMTGAKGTIFTALYINRFYEMEETIKARRSARIDFPQFTDTIKRIHENPAPYHFTNECNLINRLVTGMDAKKFKESHGIPKDEKSIRPFLSPKQIKMIDALQKADIGLMISERDYSKRKMVLEWYMHSISESALLT